MPRRRRLLHRPWAAASLGRGIAAFVRVLEATGRWQVEADPATLAMLERGEPAIGVFWHARLLLIPQLWRQLQDIVAKDRRVYAMVSAHGDGELIATALERLGVAPIRGSSGRTGASVLRAAHTELGRGGYVAIAADGPRGPAGRLQPGAVYLARQTGVPVIPLAGAVRPHWRARSWDRLLVPLPFSRGVLLAGAPIWIPAATDHAGLAACGRTVTTAIDQLTATADARCGARS